MITKPATTVVFRWATGWLASGALAAVRSVVGTVLQTGLLLVTALFALVALPGLEQPFSAPKLTVLSVVVPVGALLGVGAGGLSWPRLPGAFRIGLGVWVAAFSLSAVFGSLVSPVAVRLQLLAVGWFLLLVMTRPRSERVAIALASSGIGVALIAALQFLGADPFVLAGWTPNLIGERIRVYATLGNPNFVAAFLVATLPVVVFVGRRLPKPLAVLLPILPAGALVATGSRGGLLGLVAALAWLGVAGPFRRWRLLAAVALVGGMLILALAPSRPLATTLAGRAYIWRITAAHLLDRPLVGFGPGAFKGMWIEWETAWWRDGRGTNTDRPFTGIQDHAHSDYLETVVDSGVFALAGFLVLTLSFLRSARRESVRDGGECAVAASAGLVALLAVALVDFPFRRPTELFVFWTLVALGFLDAGGLQTARSATQEKQAG